MYLRLLGRTPQVLLDITDAAGAGGGAGASSPAPSGGSPTSAPPSSGASGGAPQSLPSGQGTGTGSPADNGPVPWDRFNDVNSRYNAVKWAEGQDATTVKQATDLWNWFDTDPEGAYNFITSELTRGGHLKPQQQQAPPPPPQAPSYLHDPRTGRPLPDRRVADTGELFYSAAQADRLVDWNREQVEARIKPLEAERELTQTRQQAQQQLDEAAKWPHFNSHQRAIFNEMRRDRRLSLEGAYNRVVLPKMRELERKAIQDELQQKVAATTSNPASASPATGEKLSKVPLRDLFRREMQKRGFGR